MPDAHSKPRISLNFCKQTLRGIGRTNPELSWYAERLLSRHFDIDYSEKPEFLIYGDAGTGEHLDYPSSTIRIFITGENIRADWSQADYALTHERIYSDRHWRVPLHRHWYDTSCTSPMRDFRIVRSRVERFCNFIYSNPNAKERIDFFDSLSKYRRVDSGGRVRNNMPFKIEDKAAFISTCKFTIAFENESSVGYSTEKIIQPLLAGSIPIYWGDPSIELDFNPDCMINVHNFETFDDVVDLVARIDQDDSLWEKYVTAPIYRNDELPEALSDAALITFFRRIFVNHRAYIPRKNKVAQRISYLTGKSGASRFARRLRARF